MRRDACLRSLADIERRAVFAFVRSLLIVVDESFIGIRHVEKRRPPPVPVRAVALEPEQQVGSAVAATGFPVSR